MTEQSRPEKTEAEIYKDVGKHRRPYVDEPRPLPRQKRPGGSGIPATLPRHRALSRLERLHKLSDSQPIH